MKKFLWLFVFMLLQGLDLYSQSVTFNQHKWNLWGSNALKYAYFCQDNVVWATRHNGSVILMDGDFSQVYSFSLPDDVANAIEYLDVTGAEPAKPYGVLVTQYLFNNDDLYEFIVISGGSYRIYNEKMELLGYCPDREVVVVKGVPYIQKIDYDDNSYVSLYSINKEDKGNGSVIPEGETILSVFGNQTYMLDLFYKIGASAKIEIKPEDGWSIYSVLFNDEDVTDELEDNVYITPPLTEESTIEIVMADNASVNLPIDSNEKIVIEKTIGGVEVRNLPSGLALWVYDTNGNLCYIGTNSFIPLNAKGIYILKTEIGSLKFTF